METAMTVQRFGRIARVASAVCLLFVGTTSLDAQSGAKNGEWRSYAGDVGSTRYSALDQINASNFSKLEVAWRFKTDNLGPRPEFQYEGTPLMAGGVLYATAGSRRAVVALNPATGEQLWMHSEQEGARGGAPARPRLLDGRSRRARAVRDARLPPRRAQRENRRARRDLRQGRRRRPEARR